MKTLNIADLFSGAGGTSQGAVEAAEALGYRTSLTAINHWDVAISTHGANHPTARHLCTGVDEVNPRSLFAEGGLDLLWASPECTHHSIARGGKPIQDQSRATAWCVVRWAEALLPEVICVENVPEFRTWGGLNAEGRPLAKLKGSIFRAWVAALRGVGYRVDWRILNAANYGDPTTRERLIVQCVRGKRKITWPNATHSKMGEADLFGKLPKWVAARTIIDWSLPSQSIYERKKPLSPKTMARIMAGLEKFGLKPWIVPQFGERAGQTARVHSVDAPLPTVTGHGAGALVEPFIVAWDHQSGSGVWSADAPLSTVTTKARHGVVEPFLIQLRGTRASQIQGSARSLSDPCPALTAGGGHLAMIEPYLVQVAHGTSPGDSETRRSRSLDDPLPTVCGQRGDFALCEPFLIQYYGAGSCAGIDNPLPTVTCNDRFGLVRPVIVIEGERYLLDIRFRMLQPHELAGAQGFRRDYIFTGNKTERVKQIGNAVPRHLARAVVAAVLSQDPDVSWLSEAKSEDAA